MEKLPATERTVNTVESLLHKTRGRISPIDASAETGIPVHEIQWALERLIEIYECRVTYDPSNNRLLFIFPYPLRQRGKKTFKEIMVNVRDALWKAFVIIYKAAIGVILIFYTVVFLLLLLFIMMSGMSKRNENDRDSGGGGNLISAVFNAIFQGMSWAAWTNAVEYDYYGNVRYKRYEKERRPGKKFIQSVYHFVFGPDRPPYDPLGDAKEAAAFIRMNNGKLTAGQIIELTGVTYDQAEARLAEYGVRFGGDLYVTEEGVVIAEFPDLVKKDIPELHGGRVEYYMDEVEPPYEMTGNTSGRNTAIFLMNLFNLFMSVFAIQYFDSLDMPFLVAVLGYFPLVFSILFFVIPLLRWFTIQKKNKKIELSIIRKKLIGVISAYRERAFSHDDFFTLGIINAEQSALVDHVLEKLVTEMQGDISLDTDGKAVYTFPRLSKELAVK
jgi:hypothetical protein